MKKIIALPLLLLCSHVFAQSLPVGKYSDAAMSNGYKSAVSFSFSGNFKYDSNTVNISFKGESKAGVLSRFQGKNFLKVLYVTKFTFGDEEKTFQNVAYIDPITLQVAYTVDLDAGEIGIVEQIQDHPETMLVGETIAFTKETTTSKNDPKAVLSITDTTLSLMPVEGKNELFEFCTNAAIYKKEDNFEAIQQAINTCVVLDKYGKKVGAFMSMTTDGLTFNLDGNIERK
jgi:hypothetical protein